MARCPDVAEANLNPLLHYEAHGRRENRRVLPYSAKNRQPSLGHRMRKCPAPALTPTLPFRAKLPLATARRSVR